MRLVGVLPGDLLFLSQGEAIVRPAIPRPVEFGAERDDVLAHVFPYARNSSSVQCARKVVRGSRKICVCVRSYLFRAFTCVINGA